MNGFIPDSMAETLYQERLREAERQRDPRDLIRDATEQAPIVVDVEGGLIFQIKQWIQARTQKPQAVTDVRRTATVRAHRLNS